MRLTSFPSLTRSKQSWNLTASTRPPLLSLLLSVNPRLAVLFKKRPCLPPTHARSLDRLLSDFALSTAPSKTTHNHITLNMSLVPVSLIPSESRLRHSYPLYSSQTNQNANSLASFPLPYPSLYHSQTILSAFLRLIYSSDE